MIKVNWLLYGLFGTGVILLLTPKGRELTTKSVNTVGDIIHTPSASTGSGAANIRTKAARIAREQFIFWQGKTETNPQVQKRLLSYWMRGGNLSEKVAKNAISERYYWSAVFIGWVMREAGSGLLFRYSTFHTGYCAAAKKNRLTNNTKNPFWLFRPSEVAPRVGDILCNARDGSGVTFDNVDDGRSRAAHGDIVVSVSAGKIEVIGGNLGDSVSLRVVKTNNLGFVSSAEYFAIVRVGAGVVD
jgi:hypothetical protein